MASIGKKMKLRHLLKRKLRRRAFALALTTAIALVEPGFVSEQTAEAAPVIGTSAAVQGNVFVTTEGAERKAQVKESIKLQDQVLTREDSALQILLLDQSTFTVGQNCSIIIDRFVYDPDTAAGNIGAKVTKGAFRFMSGKIGKKNPTNAEISTPSATIGIRGTFFEGIVGPDALALAQLGDLNTNGASSSGASIIILRGPGRSANSLDNPGAISVTSGGTTIDITVPHYAVFVPGNGQPPIGPFLLTP